MVCSIEVVTCIITGRNEVLAKVIFLHLSVILFTGGGVPAPNFRGGGWGAYSKFSGGRGVPAPNLGGCLLQIFGGGACSKFSGGVLQFSEYGHRSAGTHPTGMHSCLYCTYHGCGKCNIRDNFINENKLVPKLQPTFYEQIIKIDWEIDFVSMFPW